MLVVIRSGFGGWHYRIHHNMDISSITPSVVLTCFCFGPWPIPGLWTFCGYITSLLNHIFSSITRHTPHCAYWRPGDALVRCSLRLGNPLESRHRQDVDSGVTEVVAPWKRCYSRWVADPGFCYFIFLVPVHKRFLPNEWRHWLDGIISDIIYWMRIEWHHLLEFVMVSTAFSLGDLGFSLMTLYG